MKILGGGRGDFPDPEAADPRDHAILLLSMPSKC